MNTRLFAFLTLWLIVLNLTTACNLSKVVTNLPPPPDIPRVPVSGLGTAARDAADVLMDLLGEAELLEATAQVAIGVPLVATEVHCQALRYEENSGQRPTLDQYRAWLGKAIGEVIDPLLEGESRKALYEQFNVLQARVMALRASSYEQFVEYYTQTCN